MKGNTGKYWTKAWSLIDGCTHAGSIGCDHCWSMSMNKRFGKWPEKVTPRYDRLDIPLKTKKPTVFAIWNDLFHEDVGDNFRHNAYGVMTMQARHTYLVLTKRPENLVRFARICDDPPFDLPNVWHGLTVCNQPELDSKMSYFLRVPGHKYLSIEPMLEDIDISGLYYDGLHTGGKSILSMIDAVVVGCETGHHRRPCKLEWIRSIVEQCKAAGVPCWVKQIEVNSKVVHELEQFPEDLRVRELAWRPK